MPDTNREEIAKLETLYANNPGGRVFTHLAEAYRKGGQLDKAREILEEGIMRHQDYASAHVVLGRVLQDLNDVSGAANAFRRVLQLDPDNRIALRSLGDLARSSGQLGEALEHYRHLLTLDKTDEEVEQLIGGLESELARPPAPEAPPAHVPAAPEPPAVEPEPMVLEQPFEPATPEPTPVTADFSLTDWTLDQEAEEGLPGDLGALAAIGELSASSAAPPEVVEPAQEFTDFAMDFGAPEPTVEDLTPADSLGGDFPTDLSLGEPSAADFSIDPAAEETPLPAFEYEPDLAPEPDLEPVPEFELEPEPEPETAEVSFEAMLSTGADTSAPLAAAAAAEMPTETLAELYRSQGFADRAAEVYRKLLDQRPGDAALEAKLREVETPVDASFEPASEPEPFEMAESFAEPEPIPEPEAPAAPEPRPETEPADTAWIAARTAATGAPSPWDTFQDDGAEEAASGPSVGEYLRSLLSWRPTRMPQVAGIQTAMLDDDGGPSLVLDQVETVSILEMAEPPAPPAPAMPAPVEFVEPPAEPQAAPSAAADTTPADTEPMPWDTAPTPVSAAAPEPPTTFPWEAPAPPEAEAEAWETPAAPAASAPAVAPETPAAPEAPAGPVTGDTADEAFDSWFGAPEDSPAPAAAAPSPAPEAADEAPEGDDDLEMFRSWLQSLKK